MQFNDAEITPDGIFGRDRQNGYYFSGDIDEVQLYSKVLTGTEIKAVYDGDVLRGKWSLNESTGSQYADDSSIHDNFGTLVNLDPSTVWITGKVGGGLLFPSTTGKYIDCGKEESLNISQEITVMAWVKDAINQDHCQWIYFRNDTGEQKIRIKVNPLDVWCNTENEGWHAAGIGQRTRDWSGWHHVAWTYNSATNITKFYVDGQVDTFSDSRISTGPLTSDPLRFVRIGGGENNRYFYGGIDEVKVYARSLTASEIQAIYAAESGQ